MLDDDVDQIKEVGRGRKDGGGGTFFTSRIVEFWSKYNNRNPTNRSSEEQSLDIFTPRTKYRRKRELGWDTESSPSTVESVHHGDGEGRDLNSVQRHLDQCLANKHKESRGGIAAAAAAAAATPPTTITTPEKYASLMCISEG